jgi:hypothetical protein
VDQRTAGGRWNLLGTYYFQDDGAVTVSDDVSSGEDIVADAIRLVRQSESVPSTPMPLAATSTPTAQLTGTPVLTSTPLLPLQTPQPEGTLYPDSP